MFQLNRRLKSIVPWLIASALVFSVVLSALPQQHAAANTLAIPATPNLSINNVSLSEGQTGTTTFTFTVSLDIPAGVSGVTFDIATADNTAVAPGDYTAKSLTSQTIPFGSSTYNFSVSVNGDKLFEPDETFYVNVTNVSGANVTTSQGTGTILNDDVCTLVLTTADSGTNSLRDAIACAQPNDTITFDPGLAGQTIVLTTTEIPITQTNLTIDGSGAPGVMVDGNNAHRVFNATAPLSINDLIIQHGHPTGPASGGGLWAQSAVTLTNVSFLTNTAGHWGGGLSAFSTSVLSNTLFSGNTATTSGGGAFLVYAAVVNGGTFALNTVSNSGGQGGGLYASSTLVLSGTQFLSNTALSGAGGGLNATGPSTLTNATFISNTAISQGGGASLTGDASISGGTFVLNTVSNIATGGGGGLYIINGNLNLTGTQFLSNTAANFGGGLYVYQATSLVSYTIAMTNATFINNTASTAGGGAALDNHNPSGGVASVSGGTFERNTVLNTGYGGGGLYNNSFPLNLTGTQFLSNTIVGFGGGLYALSPVAITNATFISNTATQSGGGVYFNYGPNSVADTTFSRNTGQFGGGAFFAVAASVTGTTFSNNVATISGGGANFNSTATVTGTTFNANTAAASGGGVLFIDQANLNGAAFLNNTCTSGGCLSAGWYASNALTLTQMVSTTDDIQNQGLTTQAIDGVIVFNGSAAQSINGTGSTTFTHMEVNNTGGDVVLGQNITVTDRITLTSDLSTTSSYRLNLTSGATSFGSGDVWGNTYRNHSFTPDTAYSFGNPNVSIAFGPTSTNPSDILIDLEKGTPSGFTYAISRAYTITVNGGSPYSATLRLHYQDSELPNGESNLKLWRYNGSQWTLQGATNADTTNNWAEESGVSAFSPWGISNQTPTAITLNDFKAIDDRAQVTTLWLIGSIGLMLIGSMVLMKRRRSKIN